jgi:hypothetical protein
MSSFLETKESITIQMDPASSNQSSYIQYWIDPNDGAEYLIMANLNNYTLEVYELESRSLLKIYKIPQTGKVGLNYPQLMGFFFKDWDAVYINAYDRPFVLHLDENSEVVERFYYGGMNTTVSPKSLTSKPLLMSNNLLFMGGSPQTMYSSNYWNNYIMLLLNVADSTMTDFFKPKIEKNGVYGMFHSHHSYTLNEQRRVVIHNFSFDNHLYLRETESATIQKKIIANSKHFSEIKPWQRQFDPNDQTNNTRDQEFYIQNPSYKSIIYDKWRDVYYRFVERGVELKDTKGNFNTWYDKKPSVIILNSEFEVLGETDLLQSMYRISDAFVGEKGLYIAANNEKNPKYNEDEMVFDIYVLENK